MKNIRILMEIDTLESALRSMDRRIAAAPNNHENVAYFKGQREEILRKIVSLEDMILEREEKTAA